MHKLAAVPDSASPPDACEPRCVRAPESDVHKIRRPHDHGYVRDSDPGLASVLDLASRIAMPSLRRFDTAPCLELATAALEHLDTGEIELARRAASDAFVVIVALSGTRRESDRSLAAHAALCAGNVFLRLDEAEAAKDCFEIACRFFGEEQNDVVRSAKAENGLANALARLPEA